MENSYKYFENRDCRYYPCHKGMDELNCLFCYCPLYTMENCPGKCSWKEVEGNGKAADGKVTDGNRIKVCTDCTFPHEADHYEKIMQILKANMFKGSSNG